MLGCSFFKYFSGLNLLITLGVSLTAWCSDEIVLTVYLEQKCNTPKIKTVKLIKAKPLELLLKDFFSRGAAVEVRSIGLR